MEDNILKSSIEVDFLNKYISSPQPVWGETKNTVKNIDPNLLEKFFDNIDPFWHTDNDQLQYFIYYNNGTYFAQRRKLKYDFANKINYWQTYNFKDVPTEKVEDLYLRIQAFNIINTDVKRFNALSEVEELGQESVFFERRYTKKIADKNAMLSVSDWRVLPDVVDSYPGEKDMWIKWRTALRSEMIKPQSEFENKLEFLKYLYEIRFPIDPKLYRSLYPDGSDVEYLSTPDQWVRYDTDASTDFISANVIRVLNYTKSHREGKIRIKKALLAVVKEFDIASVYPDYDMERYEEDYEE
jgi:hypothetical protein